jgi:competence protein ComGF
MNIIDQIRLEIADCEDIQDSNESDYTKEQAMIIAYENIREIIYGREQEDNGFFDEIMDDSEDGVVYEKIKEIIEKVKEQEE